MHDSNMDSDVSRVHIKSGEITRACRSITNNTCIHFPDERDLLCFETDCGLRFAGINPAREYIYEVMDPKKYQIAKLRHGI